LLLLCPPAGASTYYVSPSGNNINPGTAASPWATLQHAADQVHPGDSVIARPGAYVGFNLTTSGTAASRITFSAENNAIITTPNATTADAINLEGASYVTIQGFSVDNSGGAITRAGIRSVDNQGVILSGNHTDLTGRWGIFTGYSESIRIENNVASRAQAEHGIYVSNSADNPIISGNISWGNHAAGIHMNGDGTLPGDGIISHALVENNIIYDNGAGGASGINCDGVQDSRIQNNLIYTTHASGISLFRIDGGGASTGNVVANNTILVASDGRWALNIQNGSTNNTAFNNVLYDEHPSHGSISISSDSLTGFTSDYNALMDRITTDDANTTLTLAQWQNQSGQDMHSFVTDPNALFVDPAGENYHLKPGSPAIDAGTAMLAGQSAPAYDLAGTPRPTATGYDIGAYEVPEPSILGSLSLLGLMFHRPHRR
jgi:hypothetical protein